MNTKPFQREHMLVETESFRKEFDALPDNPEKQEMLAAVDEMIRSMATSDRLDSAIESYDRRKASDLQRGGRTAVVAGLGMVAIAISIVSVQSAVRISLISMLVILIGLVVFMSGVFVLVKRRSVRNLFSRREWQAVSLVEALKERSQPRTINPLPIWRNKSSDHRIVSRASDYETTIQPLICELAAALPQSWRAAELVVDCDGISIRCQINGDGGSAERIEPSLALHYFCARLYAHMGRIGDRWSTCSFTCKRHRQSWSFETVFVYLGPFPTLGYSTPRALSDQELEGLISYFEKHGTDKK
jgi:hypothetical protein